MSLRPGLWPEQVGDEVLILDAEHGLVHRLSGKTSEVALRMMNGETFDPDAPEVHQLREAGLLEEETTSDQAVSRRRMLSLGGMVVGMGAVISLALPTAAAAASASPGASSQASITSAISGDGVAAISAS